MRTILKNSIITAVIFSAIGLSVGWLLFKGEGNETPKETNAHGGSEKAAEAWTCSMHPQIRRDAPGDCPICGMDLIQVKDEGGGANTFQMSETAMEIANVQTTKVEYSPLEKTVYMQGKVKVDERKISNQIAHINGRIERLYVTFTGEKIYKGQKLASIYSPELITAQKELLEAIKIREGSPEIYNAVRNKLKQWKLSDKTIDQIEQKGEIMNEVDIVADQSGVVLEKKVSVGDHVMEGTVLFKVANLNYMWVEFDAYESDLPWLNEGGKINFTVSSIRNKAFEEEITFIDPIIDPLTRTAAVRVEVRNTDGKLKPEMFATGVVEAKLPVGKTMLTVPKSAVLWTGVRSVVYVKVPDKDAPTFEFREVSLGLDLGNSFIIRSGLNEGEEVVTKGTFKVDAAVQLSGKQSMMNQDGGSVQSGHQH